MSNHITQHAPTEKLAPSPLAAKVLIATFLLVAANEGMSQSIKSTSDMVAQAGSTNNQSSSANDRTSSGAASAGRGAASATESSTATKTPIKTLVDDSILTTKVKAALLADTRVKGSMISVETVGSEVTLSGAVATQGESVQAEKIARQISGVKSVVNKVTLKK